MRRIALLIALLSFSLVVAAQAKDWPRLFAIIPGEGDKFKTITLEDRQKEIDKYESLAAYHKEELPWVYDKGQAIFMNTMTSKKPLCQSKIMTILPIAIRTIGAGTSIQQNSQKMAKS